MYQDGENYHYQSSQNQNTVEGLTADNVKITKTQNRTIQVGNYEVTQDRLMKIKRHLEQ